MLEFTATLGRRRLDLRLSAADGTVTALIGENGAGKSTVLALIAGLLRPDSGAIALDGRMLYGPGSWVPPHRRGVALLTQRALLFPHLSVRDNVAFAPRSAGASRRDARAAADRWLAEVDAAELADQPADQLSGGQSQRVAVARALAAEPRLLLLDEPLSALDARATVAMREVLHRTLAGRTALLVSHDPVDITALTDRVVVVESGRVAESGPVDDVLRRPGTPFTAELMGLNLLTGVREGSAIRTADGLLLGATPAADSPPDGQATTATVAPSAVRVHARTSSVERADLISATVSSWESRGPVVRVRTSLLAVDVPVADIRDGSLDPGTEVRLEIPPSALALGRARQ